MFTKKQQAADIIKKSSLKVQDSKKDVFARLKHLKTVLGESSGAAYLFGLVDCDKCFNFKLSLAKNMIFA